MNFFTVLGLTRTSGILNPKTYTESDDAQTLKLPPPIKNEGCGFQAHSPSCVTSDYLIFVQKRFVVDSETPLSWQLQRNKHWYG
jgi:hypothetical protein